MPQGCHPDCQCDEFVSLRRVKAQQDQISARGICRTSRYRGTEENYQGDDQGKKGLHPLYRLAWFGHASDATLRQASVELPSSTFHSTPPHQMASPESLSIYTRTHRLLNPQVDATCFPKDHPAITSMHKTRLMYSLERAESLIPKQILFPPTKHCTTECLLYVKK